MEVPLLLSAWISSSLTVSLTSQLFRDIPSSADHLLFFLYRPLSVSHLLTDELSLPSLPFWLGPHFSFSLYKKTSVHATSHFLPYFPLPQTQLLPFLPPLWNCLSRSVSLLSKPVVTSLPLSYWAPGSIRWSWHSFHLKHTPFSTPAPHVVLWFHMYSTCKYQNTWSLFISLPSLPGQSSLDPHFNLMLVALRFIYPAQASVLNSILICVTAYWISPLEFLNAFQI